jgi:hypothetical protein
LSSFENLLNNFYLKINKIKGNESFKAYASSLKDETFTCLKSLLACKKNFRLGIMLDHSYTHSSLSKNGVRALKGIDNERYNLLREANERIQGENEAKTLNFYICDVEMFVQVYERNWIHFDDCCDASYYFRNNGNSRWSEESDRKGLVKYWYDVNGQRVFEKIEIGIHFFDEILVPCFTDKDKSQIKKDDEENKALVEEKEDDKSLISDEDEQNDVDKEDENVSYESCEARKQAFSKNTDCNNLQNWVKRREINAVTMGNEPGIAQLTTYGKYMLVIWPNVFESEIVDVFTKFIKLDPLF